MARISGTRTLPPASGLVTFGNPADTLRNGNIAQFKTDEGTLAVVRADVTSVRGRLAVSGAGVIQVLIKPLPDNVGNILNNPQGANEPLGGIDQTDFSTTEQRKLAQAYFTGGVGIEKDLAVGGFIYGRVAAANTATTSSNIVIVKTNEDAVFYPLMTNEAGLIQQGALIYADNRDEDDNVLPNGGSGLTYNPNKGRLNIERGFVSSDDPSIDTTTGAFTVTGGVGIGQDLNVGGNIFPGAVDTGTIGAQDFEWADAYLNKVYSKFLGSTASNLTISPGAGMTDIIGDLRVRGQNPIGTAPVVTNTLYVTMDGNDTNDGRAQDTSRACRTIGGAMNSPYYQPGTQILVSPGLYLEDNPLVMKPYTSVRGSDIRTTFIEPINKTQDLFHVNSGCYLNYVTFLNGRSGRLEGQYDERFNRGAYATAFPPLTGEDKIDLFQSPYIQNCTNQSGPWLRDGSMYRPNGTVQVPEAVGMGSWPANTASIIVNVMSGDLTVGQSINSGQQNPGFFNARTLLLANKPFIQSQVVAWVDDTFNSGNFVYDQVKCARDTGLILNTIAQDMLNDSTSDSTFSGLQYWNQGSYTGDIPNEITATIQAITFVRNLAADEAFNTGGTVPRDIVNTNFNKILDILTNGAIGISDQVVVNGLPTTNNNIVSAYTALIDAIPALQDATIDYINTENLVPLFTYDQEKCSRDTGLIVDALALDLAYTGVSQSTFAALQYWNQTATPTQIAGELTTTTNAINYVKSLAQKVVVNDTSGTRYQTEVEQVLDLVNPGTSTEADAIVADFEIIVDILTDGTDGVTDLVIPNAITASTSTDVRNAYTLLQANKEYLKAEAIAFVEATKTQGFVYDRDKCFRDTGLIVDAIAQDVLFDGISQSTFAGLQYWNQNSVLFPSELTTTTNAINWIKSIAQKIVVNDTSGQRYHVGTQITGPGGSTTEGARVGGNFDIITDILIGGIAGVTDQIVPNGLTTSTNTRVWNAYNLLQANRAYLQDEVIAYVEATKTPSFVYNQLTCARDVGYIIDSVSFDLLYGGNRQSIQSGVYYYGYDGSSTAIPDEIPQTTAAYAHIKSIIPSIVAGTTITSYQSVVSQITNLTPGSVLQATNAQTKVDEIVDIITNGPSVAGPKTPISLNKSLDANAEHTAKLLDANREFIQAEVIAFIDQAYPPGFQYDQTKCARDVDYMVDSVSFDLLHGGNKQAIQSGVYYYGYDGNSTTIVGEIVQTTAAYNYIKDLVYYVVQGIEVTAPYQSSVAQDISLTPGSLQEALLVQSNIDYIVDVINNGPDRARTKTPISLEESSQAIVQNAAKILDANREFIQAEVIAYINSEWSSGYNQETCRRDISHIVNSVAYDLLHGGNLQSIKSGVYYYDYGNVENQNPSEVAATVSAYSFIKNIIPNIIKGEEILSPFQISVPQETAYPRGTDFEVAILQNNIDVITNIVRNGPSVAGPRTPTNMITNTSTGVLNAYEMLTVNIPFIKAEVIAFINQSMNSFQYNRQKCYRDVGIIVENMSYDMAFGGNEKSVENGLSYYRGVTSLIAGQEVQTIGAIDYIGEIGKKIIRNEVCDVLIPPDNIPVGSQVINTVLTGGEIASDSIDNLLSITTNIIANGTSVAPAIFKSTGPDAAYVSAETLMQANRTFIQEQTIKHINNNLCFPPKTLPYSQIKCRRDTRVVIDSIASDLLFPTDSNSQATFAGLQYFAQDGYTGAIKEQLGPTIAAMEYLREMSIKVIQNVTKEQDELVGIVRYSNATQKLGNNIGSVNEVKKIKSEFSIILSILKGRITGWTDLIEPNGGEISPLPSVRTTVDLLLNNIDYLGEEIVAFVNATNDGFSYDEEKCKRDTGYIIQSIVFDLLYGGNRQAIQSGLCYYAGSTDQTVIPGEVNATNDAFTFMANVASSLIQGLTYYPKQKAVKPVTNLPLGSSTDAGAIISITNTLTNIIASGPTAIPYLEPISLEESTSLTAKNAYNILKANREFLVAETIAYLDQTYNPDSFNYDQELCFRDTGLIIDAVSQDILLGGNQKSIEAGLSYWNQGFNYVAGQVSTTTNAINYARDIALKVIANIPVDVFTGTVSTQVINPFFQYGGDYMPQQAVARNFHTIVDMIERGPSAAPPIYAGSGLFSITGLHPDDVKIAPKVTTLEEISPGFYKVGLDKPTIGHGTNATIYFGETGIYPLQDIQVERLSESLTGSTSTWNQRKVDPIGSIGGALIDGGVISDRSPIQSFVFDAYTQLNQGGIGVKITNNGYAQLVSVFTIFCSNGVICNNGGIASITNSNCNFGDISLLAKGYGKRDFSGTVVNPPNRAFPFSPSGINDNGDPLPFLDQFYPEGYWPNNGRVRIFVPDADNRPHIGQVMEVIPPEDHVNEQNFPGFLNAFPNAAILNTGTITLKGVDTTDVYIGNAVYIRDQFGRQFDDNGVWYAATGTVVADVDFDSITLNTALTSGGGEAGNPTFFTFYFCGNSYFTVLTSTLSDNPYKLNKNILGSNSDPNFQGPPISQISAHVAAINHLKDAVNSVIANAVFPPSASNSTPQVINPAVPGGINAQAFVDLRFTQMVNIIAAPNIAAARAVVPPNTIVTSGTVPSGAGSAVTLIQSNLDFLADEVFAFVEENFASSLSGYDQTKCIRDVKLILQQIIYDLQTGGNYNSTYSGLSYWSRPETYHVVELGEAVNRPDLFPDGSTVNFYQRSYISAAGYLFEYVGAGTNYGALPQRGVADPVQAKETVQLNSGKVFFTSTDQNGDFRIGPGLVISQATGVLSGRTFVQSLYANMTPFILAIT